MNAATLTNIRASFAPYGFGVAESGRIILKNGNESAAAISVKGARYQVRALCGGRDPLLWSGTDPAAFLRAFWYAEPVGGAK